MNFCTNCGAELGLGRFCTNCGARISSMGPPPAVPPDATAVRDVVPPSPPLPPPPPPPPPPRTWPVPAHPADHRGSRRGLSAWWWLALVMAVIAAAVLGTWLATRGSDTDPAGASSPAPTAPTSASDEPPATEPPGGDGEPIDLAPHSQVTAPPPLPAGVDLDNNPVTYPASNMLDDDPESAYRLPGDASGTVITFELPQASTIKEVGLVNGYAKVDTSGGRIVDWYPKNRRILHVEWRFDDGSRIEQLLYSRTREVQAIEVDDVETRTVQLTILDVSAPGRGPLGKNVTAVSDVLLLGA